MPVEESLARLGIEVSAEEIATWLDGIIPEDAAGAVSIADKLELSSVVDNIIVNGPEVETCANIVNHTLEGIAVVEAWARGYRPIFNGVIDFEVDPDLFETAVQKGMRVGALLRVGRLQNKHIEMCTALESLNVTGSPWITYCPRGLYELCANFVTGITTEELMKCTNLRVLSVWDNPDITRCPPSVTMLQASGADCAMGDESIVGCTRLVRLEISDNTRFTRVPPTVTQLAACGETGLATVADCVNLQSLVVTNNSVLEICPPNVIKLVASGISCMMHDLTQCQNLVDLDVEWNETIEWIPPTVTYLNAEGAIGISTETVLSCSNLKALDASENQSITRFPFSVTDLRARGSSGISDASIRRCTRLYNLDASDNVLISQCPPCLVTLNASGSRCNITDEGISNCPRLRLVIADGNPKVTPKHR